MAAAAAAVVQRTPTAIKAETVGLVQQGKVLTEPEDFS